MSDSNTVVSTLVSLLSLMNLQVKNPGHNLCSPQDDTSVEALKS